MRPFFTWLGPLFRQPRRLLLCLGICGLLLAGASPFLWAGYHWYAGQAALKRYHRAEARVHLNACVSIWPWSRSVRVRRRAARAARREGDYEEAARQLHECQDHLGDTSPESRLEWSLLHASAGDLEKVEEHLKDHARKNPEQVPLILEALAEGYMRVARIVEALHCADEWLAREPDNVQALYLHGNILRQTGSSQKSADDYRRVVELDPEHPQARWRLAVALVDIGRYEEAAQHLEILRQRQPEDIELLVRLAICRYRLGQSREARTLLDAVLAQSPNHGLALLTRGQMVQMTGQLPEAEKWLRQAVRVMPYDYKAHWSLLVCLRQAGQTAEVEAHLEACTACKQRYEAKRALSSNMRRLDLGYTAPESLRRRITAGLEVAQADSMEPGSTRPRRSVSAASGQRGPARWFVLAGWPVACKERSRSGRVWKSALRMIPRSVKAGGRWRSWFGSKN